MSTYQGQASASRRRGSLKHLSCQICRREYNKRKNSFKKKPCQKREISIPGMAQSLHCRSKGRRPKQGIARQKFVGPRCQERSFLHCTQYHQAIQRQLFWFFFCAWLLLFAQRRTSLLNPFNIRAGHVVLCLLSIKRCAPRLARTSACYSLPSPGCRETKNFHSYSLEGGTFATAQVCGARRHCSFQTSQQAVCASRPLPRPFSPSPQRTPAGRSLYCVREITRTRKTEAWRYTGQQSWR
jgi:hypothetical protein